MDFQDMGWGTWTGLIWLRTGSVLAGSFECSKEHLGCTKCGEYLD
jgi:hypothetical protein